MKIYENGHDLMFTKESFLRMEACKLRKFTKKREKERNSLRKIIYEREFPNGEYERWLSKESLRMKFYETFYEYEKVFTKGGLIKSEACLQTKAYE